MIHVSLIGNVLNLLKSLRTCNVEDIHSNFVRHYSTKESLPVKRKEVSSESLEPKYTPQDVEADWYEWWEQKNFFKPSKSKKDSFTVLLPPPNITGSLHLGHTLSTTIQDVILRWRRMKGESVWWIPGIDHAGIACQVTVEKYIQQTLNLSKHDLGKEEFVRRVWEWKKDKEEKIIKQFKSIGASLDWTNLKFTMDSSHSELVTQAFIQLYDSGIIYQTESLVNWSCALKSAISDIEVDWMEVNKKTKVKVPGYDRSVDFGIIYNFAYKVCDEDEEIVVSTTRPETMLGDVAVAVHPNDSSYSKFQNKFVWHPFRNEKIPVIFDEFVDQTMGTRAVKITPSHSWVDYDVGVKHNLKAINVINEAGCLLNVGHNVKLHGLKRFHARKVILDELEALGLYRGSQEHAMKIPICSRSGDVIELISKKQWFMKCASLAKKAADAMKSGELKIEPEGHANVWLEWLNNIKDWNLSRQLWWGHQIPMYECKTEDSNTWVAASNLEEARLKASDIFKIPADDITVTQDPDVLDTWFSSGLLPLNVLASKGSSAENDPPISLMVTGHDILFFWVARMVMLSIHFTGKLPFRHVYLHSIVCDANGKKMSKSVGNVIQPEDIMHGLSLSDMRAELEKNFQQGILTKKDLSSALSVQQKLFPKGIPECGADALRFTLCCAPLQSDVINFDIDLCQANRHFCNKIWQAMRYYIKIVDNYKSSHGNDLKLQNIAKENLNVFDRWILSRLAAQVGEVDDGIGCYKFYLATQAIRSFLVEEFCSVYLETSKPILTDALPSQYQNIITIFFHCLETSLRLLSPFMPFLSEHLYHSLPLRNVHTRSESVTTSKFPRLEDWSQYRDVELDNQLKVVLNLLTVLRRIKKTYNLEKKPNAFITCSSQLSGILSGQTGFVVGKLSGYDSIAHVDTFHETNTIKQVLNEECVVYVKHNHDREALLKNFGSTLSKEENLRKNLERLQKEVSEDNEVKEKQIQIKQINNLRLELKKIEEFKEVIKNCDR